MAFCQFSANKTSLKGNVQFFQNTTLDFDFVIDLLEQVVDFSN